MERLRDGPGQTAGGLSQSRAPGHVSGRLHRAKQLLEKAHEDIAHEEDNGFAQGLQQHSFGHIDKAIQKADEAIQIVASHS